MSGSQLLDVLSAIRRHSGRMSEQSKHFNQSEQCIVCRLVFLQPSFTSGTFPKCVFVWGSKFKNWKTFRNVAIDTNNVALCYAYSGYCCLTWSFITGLQFNPEILTLAPTTMRRAARLCIMIGF